MVFKTPIFSVYGGRSDYSGCVGWIFFSLAKLYFILRRLFFSHPDIQRCGKHTNFEVTTPCEELLEVYQRCWRHLIVTVCLVLLIF